MTENNTEKKKPVKKPFIAEKKKPVKKPFIKPVIIILDKKYDYLRIKQFTIICSAVLE